MPRAAILALVIANGAFAEDKALFRVRELAVGAGGHAGFTLMPAEQTGVDFTNTLTEVHAAENQIRLNGSGVALGDVDGDGRCDLFVCALERQVALYRNLGGWRFTNVTASAGLDFPGNFSTGATFVDIDGDNDLDLLINSIGGGTRLFFNDGRGHFTEDADAGLLRQHAAMSSALADVDGDGDLDLYVANYRTTTVRSTGFALLNVDGRRMIPPSERGHLEMTPDGRILEHGEPHTLYLNDGHGRFKAVSWTDGAFLDEDGRALTAAPLDWGLSCAFHDLDGNGTPDLYVCNDFHSPDRIWINDGRGRFRACPRLAFRHTATFSMAVAFADVDRDGRDDILVSDMTSLGRARRLMQIAGMAPYDISIGLFDDRPQLDRTVFQLNRGDGTYAEIAHYAGLQNSEWNWSVLFLDVDLDGFDDLLAATGHMFDTQDLDALARIKAAGPYPRNMIPRKLLMHPPLSQAKLVFRNRGDLTFVECGKEWGFNHVGVSHGMALADLDNDGDLDVVVNNLNGDLGLYRNQSSAPRLAVRLKGRPPNTAGAGARITVFGGPVTQSQEMMCGGRYLSSDDALCVFAAGSTEAALRIEVKWPNGRSSSVTNARPNCLYEILEPEESRSPAAKAATEAALSPIFEDVSDLLNHRHHEEPFDDFGRQPLLPWRLSQLGPGVCWVDLDGDGWEDIVIGSGKGGRLGVFRNDGQGKFKHLDEPPWNQPVTRDQAGLLGWHGPDRAFALLAGSANYEDGLAFGGCVRAFRRRQTLTADMVPAAQSSAGPIAMADYDGDGQLDLFVGGRSVPGRYPEAAASRLLRLRGGAWTLDADNSAQLEKVGLVCGAVWTDLDADGWPELVLACEWGPVRVFHNDKGRLKETTVDLGLAVYLGLWNGVTAGDFDGDGNLDILATNWGLNSPYRASSESPYRLYYGDFDGSGNVNMLEASRDAASGEDVPERDLDAVAVAMPFVADRFPTHEAFGKATVANILGPAFAKAHKLEVNTLASTLFLNRTNHFAALPLPREAQFSTAFAASVADFNGDGFEDVFLSQNFFATQHKTPRCDAGRGLWLEGDRRGGFRPVPGQESGVRVYGEQRGAAVADYDADGRVDLVVTQNGNATRLFHNVRGRPGLRVRLAGPPGNRTAAGAMLRLGAAGRFGPAREVHAGSGYWSQDGSVQVLARSESPVQLLVRWPGGRQTISDVPPGAREITVALDGQIAVATPRQ